MPRFSIIVPVYKVQGFLRECLDSVLSQSYGDFEVIAVDDRSPDGSGAILDEYAARDTRMRVLHLPENVGLGRARNAGREQAAGDYVLFLDSDDRYTPGLLAAVAARLEATGDPDILVFDHVRTYWWGRGGRSEAADLLAAAGTETFGIRESPQYLNLFLVAWNKAYRRAFLQENGLEYAAGLYEDAPVTYRSMVLADRIACLGRIGVEYRQRRQGAITKTPGRRHFEIFPQYEGLFAFLEQRPDLDWARPPLLERALDHMLFVLAREDRVRPADRGDFYREIRSFHRRHLPEGGFPEPDGWRGVEMRLLTSVPYASYAAVRGLRDLRASALGRKRRVVRKASGTALRTWYAAQSKRPLDPQLAVYSATHHRGVSGDPAAIHAKAREIAPHIRGVWVVREDAVDALPPGIDHVTPGSRRYHEVMARATYWVNNVNWPGTLAKRPGSVHIHTHQGTPLKYMGADLLTKPGARHGFDVPQMLRRADRWDYSLVAGLHAERAWERAYPCHFASLRTGSPRNDVLVGAGPEQGREVRERLGIPAGHTVVLYAPTRRDYRKGGHVDRFDLARFAEDLGPGHTLVVRLHPSLAGGVARGLGLAELHRRGVLVDTTDEPHVEDVLLASDALVTDYSALMFDYALLDRPIVVHADDWGAFAASRGAYFDITAEAPGHVSRSYRELAWLFASGTWQDREAERLRAGFRERYCEFEDGQAAERVVRLLMLGERGGALLPAARRTAGAGARSEALVER
ncbi:bifunctional glycosyltransferase/CDP-glycerol:glycerophosphate glycerophosphotransferase [Streptomyces purpurascens]|uniref:bifunctional glycosyltransferase/CDP-glycerol:glycerophosphate glycerophosphotransferase n=1 Tax=Streptomyces purpurascens TaxID=1924 RepID=UPI001673429C|nr:bifunctional glycosyltransferase family 2 protein/CDP-glycerol:glycerophosphate glycerophosphotransferase [Streptomyces purpurascens]MCE7044753.1 bifunctional glycosyltransferase family 2 protein/CDP-glycerol:glycerophosphate glycerophosphotransferase [Streptomyces purpurascens]GHA15385.1 glycosyl transferase [Streptomyces purpurascens]